MLAANVNTIVIIGRRGDAALSYGFSMNFSTWAIFFWILPVTFSTMPSASRSGSLISLPAWDLTAPFTSWNVPAAASLVLPFIVVCLLGDLRKSLLLRLRGGD